MTKKKELNKINRSDRCDDQFLSDFINCVVAIHMRPLTYIFAFVCMHHVWVVGGVGSDVHSLVFFSFHLSFIFKLLLFTQFARNKNNKLKLYDGYPDYSHWTNIIEWMKCVVHLFIFEGYCKYANRLYCPRL